MTIKLKLCRTPEEIRAAFEVMHQLRGAIASAEELESRVRRAMEKGFQLLTAHDESSQIVGCVGCTPRDNLFYGEHLYIDDLVVDSSLRSQGLGAAILEEAEHLAKSQGLGKIVLDSGLQRTSAHKFYQRNGFSIQSYHFNKVVGV